MTEGRSEIPQFIGRSVHNAPVQGQSARTGYHFVTLFDHRYLARGLALHDSLRRHSPESILHVLALSEECRLQLIAMALENVVILSLVDLEESLPELLTAKASRSLKEYYYTLSSALCYYAIAVQRATEPVTYLDADTYFFAPPDEVFEELRGYSVGITGHNFHRWLRKREQYGKFNVGWVTFQPDDAGLECLEWWYRMCLEWCYERVESDRYGDQKYLDRWPEQFRRVRVITNPGVNCAPWNLAGMKVTVNDRVVYINGRRLIFFHFADLQQVGLNVYNTQLASCWVYCSSVIRHNIYLPYIRDLQERSGPRLHDGLGPRVLGGVFFGTPFKVALRAVLGVFLRQYIKIPEPERHVSFVVADTGQHSGQFVATRIIFDHLSSQVWSRNLIAMPALERELNPLVASASYLWGILRSIGFTCHIAFQPRIVLHMNVGQTKAALLRGSFPLIILLAARRDIRAVVSLHGSNFLLWTQDTTEAHWLKQIMSRVTLMTLLSERQKEKMIALGIPAAQLEVVPNCSEHDGIALPEIIAKQEESGAVRILFLSSLIVAKGYPTVLAALKEMSTQPGPLVEAVICGRITRSQIHSTAAESWQTPGWIEGQIAEINKSARVKVQWVRGATGAAKWELFSRAHIFIFPSNYYVEAQPIVLLEAMAFGCAIITSTVGEIPSMVTKDTAIMLDDLSPFHVTNALDCLVRDRSLRGRLAQAGRERFVSQYTRAKYIETWDRILNQLWDGVKR